LVRVGAPEFGRAVDRPRRDDHHGALGDALAEDRAVADGEATGVGDRRPEAELFARDAVEVGQFVEGGGVDG
jgi:hypothetical protein